MSISNVIEISSLNGNNGFVLNGIDPKDRSGSSVSGAGDVNGDGFDDILIGAYFADPNGKNEAGESYLVFGKSTGFESSIDLSSLNGNNGFVLNGIDEEDRSGISVSSAGDINGDGLDDIIMGANLADPNGKSYAGESYVVFGSSTGFSPSFELSSLNGNNGFVINGIGESDRSGISVSSAGDVNGDGLDDIIIGAYFSAAGTDGISTNGETYVIFGSLTGFSPSLELSSLNGNNGFVLNGIGPSLFTRSSVSSAGDVNGDGLDDIIIGHPFVGTSITELGIRYADSVGRIYVVFGSSTGFSPSFELSSLNGSNGFILNSLSQEYNAFGSSISSAGDINGDGLDDIIIGARGESYVVFGSSTGFNSSFDLSYLNGRNGFAFVDPANPVSNAGDVNGDGLDDIIISASRESYVVLFGRSTGFESSIELSSLNRNNGFVINGIDGKNRPRRSVSSAGDVNGDGFDDLIIGATSVDIRSNDSGESYVVFGFDPQTRPLTLRAGTAQIAYVAYYGRPADSEGETFWNRALGDKNISYSPRIGDLLTGDEVRAYDSIVNDFSNSTETESIYGALSNRDKIDTVYNFAFDRDAEEVGLDYWTGQLDKGNITLANFALEIALGAQNQDLITLLNKVDSAHLFFSSIDTPAETQAYSGNTAELFGRDWLGGFGVDVANQTEVNNALAQLVG